MTNTVQLPNFTAYFTGPDDRGKVPGIVLIHEVWGLTGHITNVADRLMAEGYAVLAPDLLSHTGVTEKVDQSIMAEIRNPSTRDAAQKKLREAITPIRQPEFGRQTVIKLEQCYNFLLHHERVNGKIAALGFCFGGTYAWQMACHIPNLSAAVEFYGHAPTEQQELEQISCAILGCYGEQDENLIKELPDLSKALDELEKDFEYVVYPNCGHAFFNDTNPATYNKNAADDAWAKTLALLENHL